MANTKSYKETKIYLAKGESGLKEVRKWIRSGKIVEKFFITGSNARLLSRELATHLTGRHLMKEIYPFSFREFLRFKKIGLKENFEYITEEQVKIKKNLAQYIEDGGFPEYLKYGEKDILRRLFSDVIFRDIVPHFIEKYEVGSKRRL